MKMTIEKNVKFTFDTNKERKRIAKAFKKNKETQQKLYQLIEMVEKEDFKGAAKELRSEWWKGYDEKDECQRYEYIGTIDHNSPFFDHYMTYLDLILAILDYPSNFKVIKE